MEKKGKGKEFNYDDKFIYEGEYLNGKRWNGEGKEYLNGELLYEFDYLCGSKLFWKQ